MKKNQKISTITKFESLVYESQELTNAEERNFKVRQAELKLHSSKESLFHKAYSI